MFKCDICFLASFVAHPVMSAQAIVVSADYDIGSPQTRHYSHNGNKHWETFECTRKSSCFGLNRLPFKDPGVIIIFLQNVCIETPVSLFYCRYQCTVLMLLLCINEHPISRSI